MLPDKYFSVSLTATNLMLFSFSLIYTRPSINHPNVCAVYSGIFRKGVLALVGEVLKTLPSFLHIIKKLSSLSLATICIASSTLV